MDEKVKPEDAKFNRWIQGGDIIVNLPAKPIKPKKKVTKRRKEKK